MANHIKWFSSVEKLEQPGVVKTSDNTVHPIEHVGDVPLNHVRQKGLMWNVLHVLTIAKNFVSVGQIVVQGIEVQFNHHGCLIEDEGRLIVCGRRDERMFIIKINDVSVIMLASGQKVELDIDLWHKRIVHINYLKLQEL